MHAMGVMGELVLMFNIILKAQDSNENIVNIRNTICLFILFIILSANRLLAIRVTWDLADQEQVGV